MQGPDGTSDIFQGQAFFAAHWGQVRDVAAGRMMGGQVQVRAEATVEDGIIIF